ncbi:MAG TPA: hypothetical protein GX497_09210 [Bacillus bacterium]|nr:hypothetical protein [Bacillus sp. (in: firmicutes)]
MAVFMNLLKKDLWDVNAKLLKKELLSIEQPVRSINLVEVTPFEWDVVYSFDPYTTKDKVYETVGYKWDQISETVSEGMSQIVFLKNGKVVCYVYGYPENSGYGISFSPKNDFDAGYSTLSLKDDMNFQVERSDGVIFLRK